MVPNNRNGNMIYSLYFTLSPWSAVCGLPITFTKEQMPINVLDVILQSCPSEEVIQFDSD